MKLERYNAIKIILVFIIVLASFQLGMSWTFRCPSCFCPDCSACPDNICELDYDCPDCVLTNICPTLPQFDKIAKNLANEQEYRDKYNCDEFAKELAKRWADAGYVAYYCEGDMLNCGEPNCRHAWTKAEVYYEATNGYLIQPETYESEYLEDLCFRYYV